MTVSFSTFRRPATRGFTLTEVSIVLGIFSLILGAIWVAAARVYQNNKLETASQEVAFIYSNYKSLFAAHGIDIPSGDITCGATINGMKDGFFPPSMGGSSCAPATFPASYPLNPWNGYVQVNANAGNQGIGITLGGLPEDACINLAVQTPNTADVIGVSLNGGASLTPPVSPAQATGAGGCAAGNANTVQITYKAR